MKCRNEKCEDFFIKEEDCCRCNITGALVTQDSDCEVHYQIARHYNEYLHWTRVLRNLENQNE